MAISFEDAIAQYGYVAVFAQSNPEVKGKLDQAMRDEWSSARFDKEIRDTNWFRTLSEQQRQLAYLQASDPAEYNNRLNIAKTQVALKARQMGRNLSDDAVTRIALQSLGAGGFDDNLLTYSVAQAGGLERRTEGGVEVGGAANLKNQLTQVAQAYGIPVTEDYLNGWIDRIQVGTDSIDGYSGLMRQRAKQSFPQFAQQIDSGLTMRDIADPYISQMSQTLEISDSEINLSDPWVKKALTGDGKQPMSLWQFERSLKDDARWDKTKQARNDTYSLIQQIGKDWGYLG